MQGHAFRLRAPALALALGAALVALVAAPWADTVTHAGGDSGVRSVAAGSPPRAVADPPPILPVCPLPDRLGNSSVYLYPDEGDDEVDDNSCTAHYNVDLYPPSYQVGLLPEGPYVDTAAVTPTPASFDYGDGSDRTISMRFDSLHTFRSYHPPDSSTPFTDLEPVVNWTSLYGTSGLPAGVYPSWQYQWLLRTRDASGTYGPWQWHPPHTQAPFTLTAATLDCGCSLVQGRGIVFNPPPVTCDFTLHWNTPATEDFQIAFPVAYYTAYTTDGEADICAYHCLGYGGFTWVSMGVRSPHPPKAVIEASESEADPLKWTFDGSKSTAQEQDATLTDYAWDFGDNASGNGKTSEHSYAKPGIYTATLTVTDSNDREGSTTFAVKMLPTLTATPDHTAVHHSGSYIREGDTVAFEGKNFDPDAGDLDILWGNQKMTTVPAASAVHFKGTFTAPPFPPYTMADKQAGNPQCAIKVTALHGNTPISVDVAGRSGETVMYADHVFYKDGTPLAADRLSLLCEGAVLYDQLGHPLLRSAPFTGAEGILLTVGSGASNEGRPNSDGPNRDLIGTGYDAFFVQAGFADGTTVNMLPVNVLQLFVGETLTLDALPTSQGAQPATIAGSVDSSVALITNAVQFRPATPPETDTDSDGIENAIDGGQQGETFVPQDGTFSIDFSNVPLGGNAFGQILARDGVSLHFAGDAQAVTVLAPHAAPTTDGRTRVASVRVCNAATVARVAAGTLCRVQCVDSNAAPSRSRSAVNAIASDLSLVLGVDAGPVELVLGVDATLSVPADVTVEVTPLSPTSVRVTNLVGSATDATINDGDTQTPVQPGQSVDLAVVPDRDADATADADDDCPDDAAKTAAGTCGCGVADVDVDGDGVLDCLDDCPSDPARTSPPCACFPLDPSCTGTTSTTIAPPAPVCGDPSENPGVAPAIEQGNESLITATDALFTLGAAIDLRACALCVCDVNGSGGITASDALAVLKVAVGASIVLTCPPCS